MDDKSKAILKTILELSPGQLSTEQISFLNARRGYLNDEQYRIFQEVLPEDDRPKKNVGSTYRNPASTQYTDPNATTGSQSNQGTQTKETSDELEVEIRTGDKAVEANEYNKSDADPDAKA